ncbi:hypothetical protein Dimus_037587 [Dionaea muscipula]
MKALAMSHHIMNKNNKTNHIDHSSYTITLDEDFELIHNSFHIQTSHHLLFPHFSSFKKVEYSLCRRDRLRLVFIHDTIESLIQSIYFTVATASYPKHKDKD